MQQFTSVRYLDFFPNGNNSPAMVNRSTGELFINKSRWADIKPNHRVFILLHELAHCKLQSSDELAVDAQAHKWFVEMGYSLTESVKALTRVLHAKSNINFERAMAQYKRAATMEQKNTSLSDFDGYDALSNQENIEILDVQHSFDNNSIIVQFDEYEPELSNYEFSIEELQKVPRLSIKERRKLRRGIVMLKRLNRAKRQTAIANDIQEGANTRKIYAEKGIYVPTRAESIGNAVKGTFQAIGNAVSGSMGGAVADYGNEPSRAGMDYGQQQNPQTPPIYVPPISRARTAQPAADTTKKTTDNNMKYAIYGGLGLAGIAILALIIKR